MIRYMIIATEADGYEWFVDYVMAASRDKAIEAIKKTESSLMNATLKAFVVGLK